MINEKQTLTQRQAALLVYIQANPKATYQVIIPAMKYSSSSQVRMHLVALHRKGYLLSPSRGEDGSYAFA